MAKQEKQKLCPVCGKKLSFIKQKLEGGIRICANHFEEAGINMNEILSRQNNPFTLEEIKERINASESFVPTKQIGNFVAFDDKNKKWATLSPFRGKIQQIYNYNDIVSFELLEDGNSVASGGLGRALVGGALFGGTGAIVGGVTGRKKTKEFCNSLRLKVTINDISNPVVYINFLETRTKKDSFTYKTLANSAQECLSVFQLICDKKNNEQSQTSGDVTDEIMKYKKLLDAGAITQEEYDMKKKELLNI